jgi:hypothetical protein
MNMFNRTHSLIHSFTHFTFHFTTADHYSTTRPLLTMDVSGCTSGLRARDSASHSLTQSINQSMHCSGEVRYVAGVTYLLLRPQ